MQKYSAQEKQKAQKPAQARRMAPGRAALRKRLAGGYVRRGDPEQQAEEAARRILRGETGLAELLAPRPAAGVKLPESRGEPLPAGLRAELEEGFEADLSAVRIHRDPPAHAAAAGEHARAFASGRDIYLSAEVGDLASAAGFHLLAHEVAHVLQQTGRPDAEGRLVATQSSGTALPQLAARKSPLNGTTVLPTFEEMRDLHLAGDTTKTDELRKLADEISRAREAAIAGGREAAYWESLEKEILAKYTGDKDADRHIRSFLYDVLKLAGRWTGAATLLAQDNWIYTSFYSAEVYENYPEDQGYDWIYSIWVYADNLRDYGLSRFLRSLRDYLIGPTRDIPNLGVERPFEPYVKEMLGLIKKSDELINNELFFITLWTVSRIDALRIAKLRQFAQEIAPGRNTAELRPMDRGQVASRLEQWAVSAAEGKGDISKKEPEVQALLKSISPYIQEVAKVAQQFWSYVLEFETMRLSGIKKAEWGDTVRKLLSDYSKRKEFAAFQTWLTEMMGKFFALKGDELLSSKEYAGLRNEFVKKLRDRAYTHFEKNLLLELEKDPKKFNLPLALSYGLVFFRVYELIEGLNEYDGSDDIDIRTGHRIQVARLLLLFGLDFYFKDVYRLANRVLTASLEGQTKSQLALLSDWKPDEEAPIEQITEDFGENNTVPGWEPLKYKDLVLFFELDYMKAFRERIEGLLAAEGKSFVGGEKTLLQRALIDVNAYPRPKRYIVEKFERAIRPEDRFNYNLFIREHPKTEAFLRGNKYPGTDIIPFHVIPQEVRPQIFMWLFPPLTPLIERLMQVAGFHQIIWEFKTGRSDPAPLDDPQMKSIRELSWQMWWDELKQALAAKGLKAGTAARAEFYKTLVTDFEAERTRLEDAMRRASIHERSNRAAKQLRPILEAYDRYKHLDKAPGGKLVYELPDVALTLMSQVVSSTAPLEEQHLHLAALVLELADLLHEKFEVSPRYDVIVGYTPTLVAALKTIKEQKEQVRGVLTAEEKIEKKWIDTRTADIESLLKKFKEVERKAQFKRGLTGLVEGNTQILTGVGHGYAISKGETFTIDGITYKLIGVYQNFTYYPRYGTTGSALEIKDVAIEKPEERKKYKLLTVSINAGKPIDILGDNDSLLETLAYAVTMEAILRQLQDLDKFIKGAAELTMDVLEFIPGAGQAIMAARLATSIIAFIASGEFEQMVDQLFKDPFATIEWLVGLIDDLFQPESLWLFMLFGNNQFDQLHAPPKKTSAASSPKTKTQKFMRVLRRLYGVGSGMLGATGRVQTRVRWKMERVELFVLAHPLLAKALRLVADNLEYVIRFSLLALEAAEKVSDLEKRWDEAAGGLPDKLVEAASQLETFGLPMELIPMGDLLEIIVEVIIARLGRKYRIGAAVILKLLEIAGQKQAIFDAIAAQIPEEFNPNTIWKKEVVLPLGPMIAAARDDLIRSVFDQLTRFEVFKDLKKLYDERHSAMAKTPVTVQEEELPEIQAYVAAGGLRFSSPSLLPQAGGCRLDARLKTMAEAGFSQDFSHVRLHSDAVSSKATRQAGAMALTSGSHIYLAAGLPIQSSLGKHVLYHELAHVLQQTGPRSLGQSHDSSPQPGNPGRGLVFDPGREAGAEQAASRLEAGRPARLGDLGTRGFGIQPALPLDLIRRLLDTVSGTVDIKKDVAAEEATGAGTGLKILPDKERLRLKDFLADFQGALKSSLTFNPPFGDKSAGIPEAILRYLSPGGEDDHFTALKTSLADIAIDSLVEKKIGKAKGAKAATPVRVLDIDRLETALSRFLFGETGILLHIKLKARDEDAKVEVVSLKVIYVHLPPIHGNTILWKEAIKGIVTDEERAKLLPRIRAYLEAVGPGSGIWKSTKYGLRADVLDKVREYMRLEGGLEASDLPAKKDYLNPDGPGSGLGHIGLRLGTYGGGNQTGKERESHHITQYLLLEYFANKSKIRAFPLLEGDASAYPGIEPSGAEVKSFQAKGEKLMDIAGLETGRGAAMPAILLARTTHREGRLHVTSGDDFPDKVDSPAGAVDFKFRQALGDKYVTAEKSLKSFKAYRAEEEKTNPQAVERHIYAAMQKTYHWMSATYMQPRLKTALENVEATYFNELAKAKPTKERLNKIDLGTIYIEAVKKNKKVMETWGWKG